MFEDAATIISGVVGGVVIAAPTITVLVNKFGSPKVKAGWFTIRKLYNRAYAKRVCDGVEK
jgi:hypothetical protein